MRLKFWSPHVLSAAVVAVGLAAAAPAKADYQDGKVRFGVPPWPGVTVKTEVAARLLQAMGWETEQQQLSYPVIVNAISNHDLDVYLAGWYPQEKDLIEPLVEKGKVIKLTANLPEVLTGLAVPQYVADAGVTSVSDLDAHADKFGRKIYGIDAGSGVNASARRAIESDHEGLGDWTLIESSTTGMLAQVDRQIRRGEWVTWLAWTPHWMNVSYDMHYLDGPEGSEIAAMAGTVYTITPPDIAEFDANVARFLKQFVLDPQIQSAWILEYSKKERPEGEVAQEWIANNLDVVAKWLDGVKARDGRDAIEAVRAAFTS